MTLAVDDIDRLTGRKVGTFDVPCPLCGPGRKTPSNRNRKTMRIWRSTLTFATYYCARCEEGGHTREDGAERVDPAEWARVRAETQRLREATEAERQSKARRMWRLRQPLARTIGEKYLRVVRRYSGPLPPTIDFLPALGDFSPAIISAVGFAKESGSIDPSAIQAVHLTRLARDGSGKAGTDHDKIMIGTPKGSPIVLAPINDGLGLAICEGIEDGLSLFEATGLGVWVAGSASLLPSLSAAVPSFVETVSIIADPDDVGQRGALALAKNLDARKIKNSVIVWNDRKRGRAI